MITKMNTLRVYFALAICCFISTFAWGQQNVLGFKGKTGDLQSINLRYFANGEISEMPDKDINITFANTYEMHQMGYPKLNFYIYHTVRFEADKLFVSSLGSEERIINVYLAQKQANEEKWGEAILSCEYAEPIGVEFFYDENNKILQIQYTVSENESENYMIERDNKIAEVGIIEVEEYEKSHIFGIYLVSITYLIK